MTEHNHPLLAEKYEATWEELSTAIEASRGDASAENAERLASAIQQTINLHTNPVIEAPVEDFIPALLIGVEELASITDILSHTANDTGDLWNVLHSSLEFIAENTGAEDPGPSRRVAVELMINPCLNHHIHTTDYKKAASCALTILEYEVPNQPDSAAGKLVDSVVFPLIKQGDLDTANNVIDHAWEKLSNYEKPKLDVAVEKLAKAYIQAGNLDAAAKTLELCADNPAMFNTVCDDLLPAYYKKEKIGFGLTEEESTNIQYWVDHIARNGDRTHHMLLWVGEINRYFGLAMAGRNVCTNCANILGVFEMIEGNEYIKGKAAEAVAGIILGETAPLMSYVDVHQKLIPALGRNNLSNYLLADEHTTGALIDALQKIKPDTAVPKVSQQTALAKFMRRAGHQKA